MSRPLRIEYPGAWYHVMNRGRRSEAIFSNHKDYEMFIALLQDATELWGVKVSAYCLMGNHYHILLQTPLGNLSRFMRHLNGVYTQRYNSTHGYDGQLFRGRFKSILVEEDNYLLEIVRYIHKNPLRAGMVSQLEDYRWFSHPDYLASRQEGEWLYTDVILNMLSEKTDIRQAYLKFMHNDNSDKMNGVFKTKRWPAILGCGSFVSRIKDEFYEKKRHREVPDSTQLAPDRKQILKEVCRHYGVEEKELLTGQRGKENEPRNVAIYLCRTLRNDTLIELGQEFGMSGYSPAGSAVGRVVKKRLKNQDLRKHIEKIKKSLFP